MSNIEKQILGFHEGWKAGRLRETLRVPSSYGKHPSKTLPNFQLSNPIGNAKLEG